MNFQYAQIKQAAVELVEEHIDIFKNFSGSKIDNMMSGYLTRTRKR